jgi:hypothetical protein
MTQGLTGSRHALEGAVEELGLGFVEAYRRMVADDPDDALDHG